MAAWCAALAAQGALLAPAGADRERRTRPRRLVRSSRRSPRPASWPRSSATTTRCATSRCTRARTSSPVIRFCAFWSGTGRRAAARVADAGGRGGRRGAGDAAARRGPHARRVDGGRARCHRRGGAGDDGVCREPVRAAAAPGGRRARGSIRCSAIPAMLVEAPLILLGLACAAVAAAMLAAARVRRTFDPRAVRARCAR